MLGVPGVTTAKSFKKDFMTNEKGTISQMQAILNKCMVRRTTTDRLFDQEIVNFPDIEMSVKDVVVSAIELKPSSHARCSRCDPRKH